MNEEERMLELDETPTSEIKMTELQETRRQALNLIYKKSKAARNFIDLCMTLYGRSVMEDKSDMMTNINSTLQCPSKVPVMTILEPQNVVLAAQKIFNL